MIEIHNYVVHFFVPGGLVLKRRNLKINTYLLLTKCEGFTVSYGLSFFPHKSDVGHKSMGKNQDP